VETSKKKSIQNLFDLIIEFRDLTTHNNRIEGFTISEDGDPREAKLELDGRFLKFGLHYLLIPSVKELPWADPTDAILPLFVVPNASLAFIAECRKRNVSVIDLNGFVYLRGHGLLVTLPSLPKRRFKFDQEPRNIFVGKSVRIVRALLSDPTRLWRQAELVKRTGATSGLVSRIITHLLRQGLIKKTDARRKAEKGQSLLFALIRSKSFPAPGCDPCCNSAQYRLTADSAPISNRCESHPF